MKIKRVFAFLILWFLLGIVAGYLFSILQFSWVICLFFGAIFVVVLWHIIIKAKYADFLFCLLFFFLGAIIFSLHNFVYEKRFAEVPYGKEGVLEGVIVSRPIYRNGWFRYILSVESFQNNTQSCNLNGMNFTLFISEKQNKELCIYHYGDFLRLKGKINPPLRKSNPGEKDWVLYSKALNQYGSIFVLPGQVVLLAKDNGNFFIGLIYRIGERANFILHNSLSSSKNELLRSLLFGETEELSEEIYNAFAVTGVLHILSVSGLHVGFVVLFLHLLSKLLRIPNKIFFVIAVICLIFYVFLTHCQPPVIRAALMTGLAMTGNVLGRKGDSLTGLSLACFLMLLVNPFLLFQISFQLSFLATLSLLLLFSQAKAWFSFLPFWLQDSFALSMAAFCGTAPIVAYYFEQVSPISLIANLLVVPVSGLIVILGFFSLIIGFFYLPLSQIINITTELLIFLLEKMAYFFAKIPFGNFKIHFFGLKELIVLYALIVLIFFYQIRRKLFIINKSLYFIIAGILIFFVLIYQSFWQRELMVTFMDVGQGESIYLETPGGYHILIDGGGNKVKNVGEEIIYPYLRSRNAKHIDLLFLSHPHEDHIGGINAVLERAKVGRIIIGPAEKPKAYGSITAFAFKNNIPLLIGKAGSCFALKDGTKIKILAAGKGEGKYFGTNLNENCLVLCISFHRINFLLTSDIEEEGILDLLKYAGHSFIIMKLPHHGSYVKNTEELLDAFSPKIGVISVGENRYGHPMPETLKALQERGIDIYRTDINGAITFKTDGKTVRILPYFKE